MDYYIDGTIDSIELTIGEENAAHFTLLPSAEFLKTVAEGKRKVLFVGKSEQSALLLEPKKIENEKEVIKFEIANADSALKCLLLEAKNNRNAIRVFIQSTKMKREGSRGDFYISVSIVIL